MINVIIPTYNPNDELKTLLTRLSKQSLVPDKVMLINTGEENFISEDPKKYFANCEVMHIKKEDFDHGGTRNLGASRSEGADYIIFMTQDAIPYDKDLIKGLVRPFEDDKAKIAVSYARQLPKKDCSPAEKYTRKFNYPEEGCVKYVSDLERLGIKAFFCSDVCACYEKKTFDLLGGFPDRALFNEDMVFARKALENGYGIAYCADAKVLHSHDYSMSQQFKRNFDIGASHVMFKDTFSGIKSEGEGIKLVMGTFKYLILRGRLLSAIKLFFLSAAKYAGYRKGRRYEGLGREKILKYTSNKQFWINNFNCNASSDVL